MLYPEAEERHGDRKKERGMAKGKGKDAADIGGRVPITLGMDKNRQVVHVRDAGNGRGCGLSCPACGEPLMARQGRKREWHFSHLADSDCAGGGESALHQLAKEILVEACAQGRTLRLPGWMGVLRLASAECKEANLGICDPRLEERLPCGRIADASVRLADPEIPEEWRRLLVEIRVSHAVDESKAVDLAKESRSCIEIDLSALPGRHDLHSMGALKNEIRNQVLKAAKRTWATAPMWIALPLVDRNDALERAEAAEEEQRREALRIRAEARAREFRRPVFLLEGEEIACEALLRGGAFGVLLRRPGLEEGDPWETDRSMAFVGGYYCANDRGWRLPFASLDEMESLLPGLI